jgi:hypothetical protein
MRDGVLGATKALNFAFFLFLSRLFQRAAG